MGMISIVVCSIDENLFNAFEENVKSTIGTDYEIIRIDNRIHNNGICAVYNKGLSQAKGDTVCFCHEDILFNTQNWGQEVVNLLANKGIGLAGVAGAVYKSKYPSSWIAVPTKYYRVNMIQYKEDGTSFSVKNVDEGNYSEVAVLDGCFIAGERNLFEKYNWNEIDIPGFHLYDMDMSMQVGKTYKLVVINSIRLTHYSEGNFNLEWLKASEKFHRINSFSLPMQVGNFTPKERKELDFSSLYNYVSTLIRLKQPTLKICKYIFYIFMKYPWKKTNLSLLKMAWQSS